MLNLHPPFSLCLQGDEKIGGAVGAAYVVYFDQQTGAQHGVCWSKIDFLTLKQLFPSLMEQNNNT